MDRYVEKYGFFENVGGLFHTGLQVNTGPGPTEVGQDFMVVTDPAAADRVVAGGRPYRYRVEDLLPVGFPAIARIFHPAHRSGVETRWHDVAAANDRTMHPAAEWGSLVGSWTARSQSGVWDEPPEVGTLPAPVVQRLVPILAGHTRTVGTCWFGVWEGWGCLPERYRAASRFTLARRVNLLLAGPVSAARRAVCPDQRYQSASLWWPEDRAWCVATDIDLMTTYVGGSRDCVEDLLGAASLEALPVPGDQGTTWDTDTINPLPHRPGSP